MKIWIILILSFLVVIKSCSNKNSKNDFQTGDLIFTSPDFKAQKSDFSKAINDVTKTELLTNFTHIGIVEVEEDTVWVIHASPEKGVVREVLEDFLKEAKQAVVYRLKENLEIIPDVISKAKNYLGQDYDSAFLINENKQYCSGLIYNIFKEFNVFELSPMTFKNPKTNEFEQFWVKYYSDLGINIPEGELGCNPNGMAKSEKLFFVKEY